MSLTRVKISSHNTKLGKIPSFSTSSLKTCPSKTKWCSKHCYAHKSEVQYPNVKRAYRINLEATKKITFVESMVREVKEATKNKDTKVFRLHVSGDFFNVKYIYNWVNIAKQCKDVMFYGYTRSWESTDLLPHLGILNKLSNVVLFASMDETTIKNPPKSFRIAYAADEKPSHINKLISCPQQNDKVDYCTECKLCYNSNITTNIYFETH